MKNGKALSAKYLIIGNSAGGIGAAEAIREIDKEGSLIIVSDEPYPAYSRPLISEYLAGERTVDEMLFRPADFYNHYNIELLSGKKANSLELDRQIIQLESGEQITWNKLLLATGGVPIVPKMKRTSKKGVFTFLSIEDAKAIADFVDNASQAIVIGGGLIGISVAEALMKQAIGTTIVEMKDRVLNTILDEKASLIVEENLKRAGVRVITNQTVAEIAGRSSTERVILDNGERIACDLVIIAIGVLPRTELVLNTEIKVNRGIVVDRYMSTSHQNIYSCGDVAEAYDFIYGTNRVVPIWPNAYIGGRVAGYNMAGVSTEYPGGTAMNSLSYFGLDIATAGMVTPPDASSYEVFSRQENGSYQKVILSDGLVTGMVFVKDIEKSGMVFGLMRDRISVSNFKQELLADDFGLAYFPQELRHERLGTVPPGATAISAVPAEVEEPIVDE